MLKLCGCGRKISIALSRCDDCQSKHEDKKKDRHKAYDKVKRDKDTQAFYNSKSWKIVRRDVESRDNHLCQLCLSKKKIKTMNLVHHIKELRDYPKLGLMRSNLISLCAVCHQYVHREYENGNRKVMETELQRIVERKET
ncbi:HNH endonuclease [Halalkalibacter alkalisediminis]|nr:HNH endonuclease [Halalkalibacter alkalisediminis]